MRFEFKPNEEILNVSIIYRPQEGSFDVETSHDSLPSAFTSVQVNELQLQLDERGRVLYADGYCPHFGWCETQATPPFAYQAALVVKDVDFFLAGVSVALSTSRWPVSVNRKLGWVCVGEQLPSASCSAVEFATGSIAVVDGGKLKSIWLKPTALPA